MTTPVSNSGKIFFEVELEMEDAQTSVELLDELSVILNQGNNYEASSRRGNSVLDVIVYLAQNAWDNKDLLMVLFAAAKPALEYLLKSNTATKKPLKVTVELEGQSMIIEADDVDKVQLLAEKFRREHPEAVEKSNTNSKLKVKGRSSK